LAEALRRNRSDRLLGTSAHLFRARGPSRKAFLAAKQRGAKIIAIKPSVEPDVGMADMWVPLRPGTDAALALAMLHVVIQEDLLDHDFIDRWCSGFGRLKTHVKTFTPSWAAGITGVPEKQIVAVARIYATTRRAVIDLGNGVEHTPSSNDAIRAVAILMAITGHLDRPGTNLLNAPPSKRSQTHFLQGTDHPRDGGQTGGTGVPQSLSAVYRRNHFGLLPDTGKRVDRKARIRCGPLSLRGPRLWSATGDRGTWPRPLKSSIFLLWPMWRAPRTCRTPMWFCPLATSYEVDHPFQDVPGWLMATNRVIDPIHSTQIHL
jgi:hypothetical protein